MSTVSVYSFADATGLTQYVDDNDFTLLGAWSAQGTYTASPLSAVSFPPALYMCIRDNIGDNPHRPPTRTRPQSWSIMSLLYEYQSSGSSTGSDALAEAAWELAQTGTNIAWAAYYLAQIGTNTGSAAYDLAGSAFTVGTDAFALAGSAFDLANEALGTANGAFTIAVDGTNAAATAQSTANAAYALAVIGTNLGSDAYALAQDAEFLGQTNSTAIAAIGDIAVTASTNANTALARLNTGLNGTNAVWVTSTENGVLTDTQLTFVSGLLTKKTVDSTLPTHTDELFSFVKFFNFVCAPTDANACIGTFAINLSSPDYSWTNNNSYFYNRIGAQNTGGMGRILILDAPVASAGTVMAFLSAGTDSGTFARLSAPEPVTRLFQQGTYYVWNADGAPPGDNLLSLRLDGIAFIGG